MALIAAAICVPVLVAFIGGGEDGGEGTPQAKKTETNVAPKQTNQLTAEPNEKKEIAQQSPETGMLQTAAKLLTDEFESITQIAAPRAEDVFLREAPDSHAPAEKQKMRVVETKETNQLAIVDPGCVNLQTRTLTFLSAECRAGR